MSILLSEYFPKLLERYKTGETTKAPVEDFIVRIDERFRPEIITLDEVYVPPTRARREGEKQRILLLRSPHMPELAFVVFGKEEKGTYWRIRLSYTIEGERFTSRQFLVVCACCAPHKRKLKSGLKDSHPEEYEQQLERLRKDFPKIVESVCVDHGIKTLFFRRASAWEDVYERSPEPVEIVEAGEYKTHFEQLYGDGFVRDNLSWLLLCDHTGGEFEKYSRVHS